MIQLWLVSLLIMLKTLLERFLALKNPIFDRPMAKQDKRVKENLRLIAKSSIIVFFGILLSKILTYLYRIIVARHFGPEVYGIFALAVMISGWFIALSTAGLTEGMGRFLPLYQSKNKREYIKYLFSFSSTILVVTSLLMGILLFLTSGLIANNLFHNSELKVFLQIFSVSIPFSVLSSVFLGVLKSFREISWHSFIFNILQNAAKITFLLFLILLGLDIISIPLSYIAGIITMFMASYLVSNRKFKYIFSKYKLSSYQKSVLSKSLIKYSLPMVFFGVISMMFYWIDSFFIGYYKSPLEVGIYNAAVPIAMLLMLVPELFIHIFFPIIVNEYSKNKIFVIEELSKQITKWILIINLPFFALLVLFPGAAINLLFGSEYLVAQTSLRILAIGVLISSLLVVSSQLIYMVGKSKTILLNIIIASLVNVVLNIILIPQPTILGISNSNGINGAAIATTISLILLNLLSVIQARKTLSINIVRRKALRVVLVGFLAMGLLILMKNYLEITSIVGIIFIAITFFLAYLLLIFLTRSFDKNDYEIINSLYRKIVKTSTLKSKEKLIRNPLSTY